MPSFISNEQVEGPSDRSFGMVFGVLLAAVGLAPMLHGHSVRSWAFEAQLRAYLKEKFGTRWFASREAGSLLRELWAEGQRMRAEEMLKEVTGSTLEMEAVAERVKEALP